MTDKMLPTEFDKKAKWDFKTLSDKFGVTERNKTRPVDDYTEEELKEMFPETE